MLQHGGDMAAHHFHADFSHRHAIEIHCAGSGRVETKYHLHQVDLPPPEAPTSATFSPGRMVRLTPFSTGVSP